MAPMIAVLIPCPAQQSTTSLANSSVRSPCDTSRILLAHTPEPLPIAPPKSQREESALA
jgi:hypothetical protein